MAKRKRKKMTEDQRAKRAIKNARRGRTPAYLEAKRWADRKLKPKPYSLPKILEVRESGEIEKARRSM